MVGTVRHFASYQIWCFSFLEHFNSPKLHTPSGKTASRVCGEATGLGYSYGF